MVDFVRETLPPSQHQIEDPRCQIDISKLEEAISGNDGDFGLQALSYDSLKMCPNMV